MVVTPLRPAWLTSSPIAHRGLHDLEAGLPENSLAAFEAGYPCELDVQLTNSGAVVILHDFDLGRATGVARPTVTLTAEDLPNTRLFGGGQHVPTLAQVIECVLDPVVVYALRITKSGFPIGQISGLLRTAGPLRRLVGRSLASNFFTRPDFISYELASLPSRIVEMWRDHGVTVLSWPIKSSDDERKAREYADNIIFSDFLPDKIRLRRLLNVSRHRHTSGNPYSCDITLVGG